MLETGARSTDQVLCGDGLSTAAGGHHHLGQALPHVLQAAGEGKDGHDFTGHRDVKLGLGDSEQCADQQGLVMKEKRRREFTSFTVSESSHKHRK